MVCHSLLNNDLDNSSAIFRQMIDCLKVGGFAVFAARIGPDGRNQFEAEIKELEKSGFWKFKTEHQFDKVYGVKFPSRKALYLAFEKVDHDAWRQEQGKLRLAEVAEQDRLRCVQEMMRQKMLAVNWNEVRAMTNSRSADTEHK